MRQDSFRGLLTHQALADGAPIVHQIGNGQHFATGQLQTLGRIIADQPKAVAAAEAARNLEEGYRTRLY